MKFKVNTIKSNLNERITDYFKQTLSKGLCLIPKYMNKNSVCLSVDEIDMIFDNIPNSKPKLIMNTMNTIYKTYEKPMFHRYIKEYYRIKTISNKYNNLLLKKVFKIWKSSNIQEYEYFIKGLFKESIVIPEGWTFIVNEGTSINLKEKNENKKFQLSVK